MLKRILFATVLASTAFGQAPPEGPLNLLFVIDDQHNARMLGVEDNGHGGAKTSLTPRLDELSAGGMRFSNAYCATPQCRPSRFSMLTGRYAHHHGLRHNPIWEPAAGELTLATLARRHGYATATIGKHHMNWLSPASGQATDHGFDLVVSLQQYNAYCKANGRVPWSDPHAHWAMPGLPPTIDPVGYTFNENEFHPAGYLADRAIEFLDDRVGPQGDGRPFALWLSFFGPHTPILPSGPPSAEDWAHRFQPSSSLSLPNNFYRVADTPRLALFQQNYSHVSPDMHREVLAYYYGLTAQIDHNVGRVLDRLEELAVADRTVVVFTADHGEYAAEMGIWAKGAGMHDPVARVPLLLRVPGVTPGAGVSEVPVSHIDLFPTLVELLGLSPSQAELDRVDGRSLVSLLRGDEAEFSRDIVFSEAGAIDTWSGQMRAVMSAHDKYTYDEYGGPVLEYFDLDLDPWEEVNRIQDAGSKERIGVLRSRMSEWWSGEVGHAPHYLSSETLPAPASEPFPANGTSQVPRDSDLSWQPATGAASQEIYLGVGVGEIEMQLVAVRGPMTAAFNPGNLPADQVIRWRVDGINAHGRKTGPSWWFETGSTPSGPGLATAPGPEDGAVSVPRDARLTWSAGAGASFMELWFGPADGTLERVADVPPGVFTSYAPPGLLGGRRYAWRVDTVDPTGRTEGDTWTFEVDDAGLPEYASAPAPAHLATGIALAKGQPLTWSPGSGATAHDVYFGAEFPLQYRGCTPVPEFVPGPLEVGRTYYWRIDEVNAWGVRTGFTWSFDADE